MPQLTATAPSRTPGDRRDSAGPMNPSPVRILVVDDQRHNRELLDLMLTREGFLVLTAASGEEALAIVAQLPPDLVLLDVMMPRMSGYEVAARMRGTLATRK